MVCIARPDRAPSGIEAYEEMPTPKRRFSVGGCGGGGIRTLEGMTLTRFRVERFRPLSHPSVCSCVRTLTGFGHELLSVFVVPPQAPSTLDPTSPPPAADGCGPGNRTRANLMSLAIAVTRGRHRYGIEVGLRYRTSVPCIRAVHKHKHPQRRVFVVS